MRLITRLSILAVMAVPVAAANASVVLYDNLNQSYTNGFGAWEGGAAIFGSSSGLQAGQRVTAVAGGEMITEISGRWICFADSNPATALIQVYNLSGNTAGSLVSQTNASLTKSSFTDSVFGLVGIELTASGLALGGLVAGSDYIVTVQPIDDTNWGFLAHNDTGNQNSFVRDFSTVGSNGGHGVSDWTESGSIYTSGDMSMRVTADAVPEPASMAALGLGVAALIRKRRKK